MTQNRTVPAAILALLITLAPLARADVPAAVAELETPSVFDTDEGASADSDDPAIWVNPLHRRASLVLATKKNAGMDVFDLRGRVLHSFSPPPAPS